MQLLLSGAVSWPGQALLGMDEVVRSLPIALYGLVDATLKTIELEDYQAVQWLGKHWKLFDNVRIMLAFAAVGDF
jgi:hypothetical protein